MKHLTSQILERNTEHFSDDLLIINPPDADKPSVFAHADIICFDYRSFLSMSEQYSDRVTYGLGRLDETKYRQILLYMPKSKAELSFQFEIARSALRPNGKLFLVGEKKAGINSGAKHLAGISKEITKLDSAKHCQLWEATPENLTTDFVLEQHYVVTEYEIHDKRIKTACLPGVFSAGRLDEGTSFLLAQKLKRLKGRTLDFGCGAGVIASYIKLENPELSVEAVDTSWLAIESTKQTLKLNGLEAKVYASNGWSDVEGRVNGVVSNPPFHQGVSTEYETTESFIRQAYNKMARYAPMYLVANNFLKYPSLIESVFGQCQYVAKGSKFNVYYCER